ncbi:MAG: aspartate 1-decarboxylase [Deltaproteobacteria bacterium]|nr:aspartate 1-decarboxylase [Deltaproteobacteria bacterium]
MFLKKVLTGKIHGATVTGADINYMGSITVDSLLLETAGIRPLEEVEIWNVSNGERFTTYALPGKSGGGDICLNGSAARRVQKGDRIIIATYAFVSGEWQGVHEAKIAIPDEKNRLAKRLAYRVDYKTGEFSIV